MTVSTIDFRSESATAPVPLATGLLAGIAAVVLALQCIAGGRIIYPAVDFLPWKAGVATLTVLAVAGLPILGLLAFVALRKGTSAAAWSMGRFLRFCTYAFVLSFLATLGLEHRFLGPGIGAGMLTALRGVAEAGLLVALFVSVQRSRAIREICGRTFPARVADGLLRMIAGDGAAMIIVMLASLVLVLGYSALPSIENFGLKFLTTADWRSNSLEKPIRDAKGHIQYDEDGDEIVRTVPPAFGALAAMYGTMVTSGIALLCAVPASFGAALFLVRVLPRVPAGLPRALVSLVSFLIEFLAAIPSIAYGIWGLFMLAPFLANHLEPPLNRLFGAVPGLRWLHTDGMPMGRDMLCGGIVLAIMILPIITAVSRDVLASVPRTQIEGTLALGATWWQSCWGMLRYAKSGLFGAVMLGLARAAGETMAVAMVISDSPIIHSSWFAPGRTMAGVLANEFGEADTAMYRGALVEVALILLVMSLLFNIIARWLVVGRANPIMA
ncbi:MAG TPA: phosphate ABC transporter permease subunit PstC [Tepidisphaeraceae bacterium]|jgi:phosphate transport system permease protein|nr:phosphate ABC transporter permease subunit PstC [Tepidisphaeraceae bacterium]